MQKKYPFWHKTILLLACVTLGTLIGQGSLLLLAYYMGADISTQQDILDMLSDPNLRGSVKAFIGFNHVMTFIAGPLLYLWIVYRGSWNRFLHLSHFNPLLLLLFPMALWSLYPLMGYLGSLMDKIPMPDILNDMDKSSMDALMGLLKMDGFGSLMINLLIIGILPGIGEELLFRGVIQKEIQNRWLNPHTAIWVTAFIFAAMHLQVAGLLPKMMIGVLLGYAYYYSGSLILPMVLHCLNNSMATLAIYFSGESFNEGDTKSGEEIPILLIIISTLIFLVVWTYITKVAKERIISNPPNDII